MKWKRKPETEAGDMRVRRGFLFFPKLIADEWRWFEFATWEERAVDIVRDSGLLGCQMRCIIWNPIRWVDKEEAASGAWANHVNFKKG